MTKENQNNPPVVLMILDGFGICKEKKGNAVTSTSAPYLFKYMDEYASSLLKAHGRHVGLFEGQSGNSEAGHFNIGAGRVVKQDLVMISDAIENGTFFKNPAFANALEHAEEESSKIHVMVLLTDGQSAHAHPSHFYAVLKYLRQKKIKNVYLHIFTDGRDSTPHSAIGFLNDLRKNMKNGEHIATVGGRFYGMDRNKLWKRTKKAYDAMVLGKGYVATSAEEAIEAGYNRNETDEYLQPTVITKKGKPIAKIDDDDVILFFNARSDRARQLTKAFVQKDFNKRNPGSFKRKKMPHKLHFVAMTDFGPDLPGIYTAFPSPDIPNALAGAVGERRKQLYISETEKYAHVTYFINGGFPEPINGEDRELVASTGHANYAEHPQMSCRKVTNKILSYIKNNKYDFITVNFPNADMVGHTGDFQATKKAVRYMDMQIKRIVEDVLRRKGTVIITADHGNAECMLDVKTGQAMTEHTSNPVPCIVISKDTKGKSLKPGKLADVAPTVLKIMGINKSKNMTGRSLL